MKIYSDLFKIVMLHKSVASHLTVFNSDTFCWRARALLFSRCISILVLSRLFLFCSSSILQCICIASTFSASHFPLSSSIALCTWMRASHVCHAIMLKKFAYFRQRIIRIPFPKLLHAAPLHIFLPPPSAVPKISLASLLLPLCTAERNRSHL